MCYNIYRKWGEKIETSYWMGWGLHKIGKGFGRTDTASWSPHNKSNIVGRLVSRTHIHTQITFGGEIPHPFKYNKKRFICQYEKRIFWTLQGNSWTAPEIVRNYGFDTCTYFHSKSSILLKEWTEWI